MEKSKNFISVCKYKYIIYTKEKVSYSDAIMIGFTGNHFKIDG